LERLARTGIVDDRRFAERRAAALAERGAGDALIRHDLAGAGVDAEFIDAAVGGLEGEHVRVDRIVERRGASAKTARYLAAKGFSADVVHAVVARGDDDTLG
jgi:SOS response regulatory protein OraA/RecX